jgi:hypothetical protein
MTKTLPFIFFLCPILIFGQVNLTSSNLPILVITTDDDAPIVDEPKIDAHLGIVWNENGQQNVIADGFNHYDGKIGIEIRGASSQWFDKKSYSFETRNEDDSNNNVPLLGLPRENDWVLHGPYSDKSLMRNAITYIMAGWIMEYAPRVRFCEVIINEHYKGVYFMTEKIKVDKNRVNISKMDADDISGDELTGGYIIKIDKEAGDENGLWTSGYSPQPGAWQETRFLYHYPKPNDITTEQEAYIQDFIGDFELTLKGSDYDHPTKGYRKFIDVESFIDFMIINEVGRNVDGYRLSTFMYKDRDSKGGKLKKGPVWDFNLAFGNVDYCTGPGTAGWALDFNQACPDDFWIIHFWWDRLRQDEAFYLEAEERWKTLRQEKLSDERIFNMVDSLADLLLLPATRNFQQWSVLNNYVWPNSFVGGTYNAEVQFLKDWLKNRLAWLDGNFRKFGAPVYDPRSYFDPKASPNPFQDEVTFEYYVGETEDLEIRIFNSIGQLVGVLQDFDHLSGEGSMTFSTNGLTNGIYFYGVWIDNKKVGEGKLVKN